MYDNDSQLQNIKACILRFVVVVAQSVSRPKVLTLEMLVYSKPVSYHKVHRVSVQTLDSK